MSWVAKVMQVYKIVRERIDSPKVIEHLYRDLQNAIIHELEAESETSHWLTRVGVWQNHAARWKKGAKALRQIAISRNQRINQMELVLRNIRMTLFALQERLKGSKHEKAIQEAISQINNTIFGQGERIGQ